MKRLGLFGFVLGVLVFISTIGLAAAHGPRLDWGAELNDDNCDGELVINVAHKVTHDFDSGTGGNNWALDDYNRQIQVWQVGESEFCAIASYHGSFTTLAGQSPGNADDISEGINGKMDGGYRLAITGASLKDMPDQPPHSNLGKYDYGCDADPSCPGQFNWLDIYFDAYNFSYD